jgi:rhamnose utilization protein RhaD (predicted bifunctional aldolase and dehydrogenase)
MSIQEWIELSRFYGNNPDYILAGGGNTSWKNSDTLYVKASGFSLADANEESFVKMDRKALAGIWEKNYPEADAERESAVLSDMMAAKKPGAEHKRPSVEALLHDILPFSYVFHLHPALVNGLTCSRRGEHAAKEVFEENAIWIPITNPGYILAALVKKSLDTFFEKNRKHTQIILLQNHGIFVGADSVESIRELYDEIMSKIGAKIMRKPDFTGETTMSASAKEITQSLAGLAGAAAFMTSNEIAVLVKGNASFTPVSSAFTPDHIVYAGSDPLFTGAQTGEGIRESWEKHVERTGSKPKLVAVQGLGVFGAAETEKAANLALLLFKDTVKVAVYSESFGGPLFMTQDKIDFINNWEVERYRSSVSTK